MFKISNFRFELLPLIFERKYIIDNIIVHLIDKVDFQIRGFLLAEKNVGGVLHPYHHRCQEFKMFESQSENTNYLSVINCDLRDRINL